MGMGHASQIHRKLWRGPDFRPHVFFSGRTRCTFRSVVTPVTTTTNRKRRSLRRKWTFPNVPTASTVIGMTLHWPHQNREILSDSDHICTVGPNYNCRIKSLLYCMTSVKLDQSFAVGPHQFSVGSNLYCMTSVKLDQSFTVGPQQFPVGSNLYCRTSVKWDPSFTVGHL